MLIKNGDTPYRKKATQWDAFYFDGTISLSIINLAKQAFSIQLSFYWA